MSAQSRSPALKGRQTCRFLARFSADIAAETSRWTLPARRIATTAPAACGPGTLIATSLVTGRLPARAAWSRSRSPSAASTGGC
jgi:hypothetical protein